MAYALAADMVGGDSGYDTLIDILAEASARFEQQQEAIIDLRHLCESWGSEDVHSEQVLEVLERHGA